MADTVHQEWKPFGREIRKLRVRAGLSQSALGVKMQLTGGMVGHLERATRVPMRDHVDKLDEIFATGGELVQQWLEVRDGRAVLPWFRDSLLMERRCRAISEYHSILVPGLIQTPNYTRVLVAARQLRKTPEEIEEVVKLRADRLPAIRQNRPALWFVVDEVVITRVIGDEATMHEQLAHIMALAEDGTIRFQVIPGDVRRHCGLCSPFRLMTMQDNRKAVRMEHTLGGTSFDKADEVEEMAELFGALQAEALSPTRTLDLLKIKMKGLQ
jgi:transcriptional regulator with XRE-family HTH domain